jgi:hypothetical protein
MAYFDTKPSPGMAKNITKKKTSKKAPKFGFKKIPHPKIGGKINAPVPMGTLNLNE